MERSTYGLRKGAWTEEEDLLLKQYVEKYGEQEKESGIKFFSEQFAGLNRCRKSCRMRWLNYLKPNIKRGGFAADEVDLMIRLHKLLGNRWSQIDGRLPGRTANDVKNYWNKHLWKKEISRDKDAKDIVKVNVIKPRPRTCSRNFIWLNEKLPTSTIVRFEAKDNVISNDTSSALMPTNSGSKWWPESLLDDKDGDHERATCTASHGLDKYPNKDLWDEKIIVPAEAAEVWNNFIDDDDDLSCLADHDQTSFDDMISLWDFLNA